MGVCITTRKVTILSRNCFTPSLVIRMISDELANQTREAIAEALDRLQTTTLLVEQLETQVSETARFVRSLSSLLEELVAQGKETE